MPMRRDTTLTIEQRRRPGLRGILPITPRRWFAVLALAGAVVSAQNVSDKGDGRAFYPDDPVWEEPDRMNIPPVEVFSLTDEADFIIHSFQHPAGDAGPAVNVNTLGEVPNSSWFTNRIGQRAMSAEQVAKGPDQDEGPAAGTWTITGSPPAGITPKFFIKDSRGDTYVVKLDPPQMAELPSSAEMISTKIFYALGYNVPQNYLVYFKRSDLQIGTGAKWKDKEGIERSIINADVDDWINQRASRSRDGSVPGLASKFIEGRFVGEFQYYGTRSDDPDDIYPHEKMRQLRGMRVFAAWLNHDDSRSINTFGLFVQQEESDRFPFASYLIDFGSTLGSGSTLEQEPRAGYEYLIDASDIGKGMLTFGLWQRPWMRVKYPEYSSIGNIESDFFEPWKWKPEYPNPAFERMDQADAFWGAKLLVPFSDEVLSAVVKSAKISDPKAEQYLLQTIIARRDKCIRYWIAQTNPLDRFEINSSGTQVKFDNAAVRENAYAGEVVYEVLWAQLDNLKNQRRHKGPKCAFRERRWTSRKTPGAQKTTRVIAMRSPASKPSMPAIQIGRSPSC